MKWIKALQKHVGLTVSEEEYPKTLMRFNRNALFKGHDGGISINNNKLFIYNRYYGSSTMQVVDDNGIVQVAVTVRVDKKPLWLINLIKSLENKLNKDLVSLYIKKDDIYYTVGQYELSAELKAYVKINSMLSHKDSIDTIKLLKRRLSKLMKNIKSCNEEYLIDMIKGMNDNDVSNFSNQYKIHYDLLD